MLRLLVCAAALAAACVSGPARSQEPGNFDIRLSDDKRDALALQRLQARSPQSVARFSSVAAGMQAQREALAERVDGLQVLAARETGGPEIVGVARGGAALAALGPRTPEAAARAFLSDHAALYGLTATQVAQLALDVAYANPARNLQWVRFRQDVNGLPLFRGEVTVALGARGDIVRTIGQLAGGVRADEAPRTPALDALDALLMAAADADVTPPQPPQVIASDARSARLSWPGVAEPVEAKLMYFPLGRGALELAWASTVPDGDDAWYTLVSAIDGTVLFRKNLTEYAPFTYTVYPTDNPAPLSPGPDDPTLGTQGARILPSQVTVDSLVTTVDPAANPWLPAGATVTDGNNVEAGLDIASPDGVDATVPVSSPGVFGYVSNPPPGIPAPGDDVTTAASRNAAVVNLFYWSNRFHDATYDLGFTEAARNFQNDNYGRGGVGGDRISAEAQDSSGTNNANFFTPPDGGRGRMQMYVWTGPTPDRDGSLDAEIIIHEFAHGLSNRLHADSTGLGTNMARGMGEGWSDFYAHSLLSDPSDPIDGVYAMGGYSTYLATAGFTGNYYYGIRRFPKAILSATGGPSNLPFNPLTFADIDDTQIDLTDGAYPRGPFGVTQADQVHNAGEVWSSALWDARANVIGIHGAQAGNQRMLQVVTDGMKLSPANPTFLDARDSILAADCAGFDGEDELAIWQGFADRGMGFSAQVLQTSPARVVEAFDLPFGGAFDSVSMNNLSCGATGRKPAPGEELLFEVEITNIFCGTPQDNIALSIVGGETVVIGTLQPGETATRTLAYTVPGEASCGTTVPVSFELASDGGVQTFDYTLDVGEPGLATIEFTNATPVLVPGSGTSGAGAPYPSGIAVSGVTEPVAGISVRLNQLQHTWHSDVDALLVAPNGQSMIVYSDVLNNFNGTLTITLADDADVLAPSSNTAPSGPQTWKPTNHGTGDAFAGAPAGPHAEAAPAGTATFADFAGIDPNGTWNLYLLDDASQDAGQLLGGWTLGVIVSQTPVCEACLLTVGGDLQGLAAGSAVVLQNNGGDDLLLGEDNPFAFSTPLLPGESYDVTVATQPSSPRQRCGVGNGSGVIGTQNVSNVIVSCALAYVVGGTVSGLAAGNTVTLQNNGGDDLVIGADGAFEFPTVLLGGDAFDVGVSVQPSDPDQLCTVAGGSGTIPGADVLDVTVTCVSAFPVGGSVNGLAAGNAVGLRLNGGDVLDVSADGAFTFPDRVADGGGYTVTVDAQPTAPNQTCAVGNGTGTISGAPVDTVSIACTTNTYAVGGTVEGLPAGGSVTLQLNGAQSLVLGANGPFAFAGLPDGSAYSAAITAQSVGDDHVCHLREASGTLAGAAVDTLHVLCRTVGVFADSFEQ